MRRHAAPDGYPALVVGDDRDVILAGPRAGFGSLQGLIEVARHNPGELIFATAGAGSPQRLAGELFFQMAGIRLKHVAYRDAADAVAATMANDTQVLVETAAPALAAVAERSLVPPAVRERLGIE
jgi:tripartite-type tricarboxylate transporter receptor subunit TctC